MTSTHSHLWPGVPLALGSAVLFGASTPFSKLLLESVDPWILAGVLYLGAGLGLALVQAFRSLFRLPNKEAPIVRGDYGWLTAVALFGGVLGPLLLMLGLTYTSAANGSLLLNLEGVATMAIAWLVFRENVDGRLVLGAAAILGGAALLSWQGAGLALDSGALFISGACVCWGIDNNLTRKLSAGDPVQIAMIKGIAAGSTNLALALALGAALPSPSAALVGGMVGFFGIGVSLVLFVLALRYLGTARTGAYFSLAPFIGAGLSFLFFPAPVGWQFVAAGLFMSIGLYLHLAERHQHEHVHEPLEHDHLHVHDGHHQHTHSGPITEPHSHWHRHEPIRHKHPHYPDLHHRHTH